MSEVHQEWIEIGSAIEQDLLSLLSLFAGFLNSHGGRMEQPPQTSTYDTEPSCLGVGGLGTGAARCVEVRNNAQPPVWEHPQWPKGISHMFYITRAP